MNIYKIIIIITFTSCMFASNISSFGYGYNTPLYTHFTYMFFHAGYIHLIFNSYVFYTLTNNILFKNNFVLFTLLYLIAVITSFIAYSDYPTIGASTMIFAMAGINFPIVKNKKKYLTVFPLIILTGFIIPHVNGLAHAVSAILGIISGFIKYGFDKRKYIQK